MLERGKKVQDAIDKISISAFKNTQKKAEKKAVCICCGALILGFKDPISTREYHITGMCQACQDSVYEGEEEDE